jgi:uncharacterized membrane protein YobD (UPF0266 family)
METQSVIVLLVVWLVVAIPAIYFLVKGSRGDCTDSEKALTRNSSIGALVFVTAIVLLIYFAVKFDW